MANSQRILVQVVRDLARERGLAFRAFSHEWILRLEGRGTTAHIFGYDFPLNSAAAHLLARDKAATSDILGAAGVPRIEHALFPRPELGAYVDARGNGAAMAELAERHGFDVVVKPNVGTGGYGVSRARDPKTLEERALRLFASGRDVCLSPYRELAGECRAIVLDGVVLTAFRKERPMVEGDGKRTLGELALAAGWRPSAFALDDPFDIARLRETPAAGERRPVNWRHNLGQGSRAEPLEPPPEALTALALAGMAALGLRFASVDAAEVASGPDAGWRILEINAGVMMECFARQLPDGRARTRAVYAAALDRMFSAAAPGPA